MATEVGVGYVSIVPSAKGFAASLAAQTAPAITGVAAALSTKLTGVGSILTKKLTLPLVAVGAAGVASAIAIDKGLQEVVARTGATGESLDDLLDSMRTVGKTVPQDFKTVGAAIGEVNTRLGLTGKPLEEMSKKMLDFARLAGTDVVSTVANITRVFGDWGVKTKDQARTMDTLYVATKQSGIGLDRLTQLVVQYGAPLRQMGFSMEEAIAIFSKFEKEGVNTQTALAGFRVALGKLAQSGEDPKKALRAVMEEIQSAGTQAEANAAAFEFFGARAGPDMAAAIREGRFEIDDMVAILKDSKGALASSAEGALTFTERVDILKNRLVTVGEAIGRAILPVLEALVDIIGKAADWFDQLPGPVKTGIVVLGGLAAAAGPVLFIVGKLIGVFAGFGGAIALLSNPIGWVIAAIAAIGAGLVLLWNKSETFRDIVTKAWEKVKEVASRVWDALQPIFEELGKIASELVEWWKAEWPSISKELQALWTEAGPILKLLGGALALMFMAALKLLPSFVVGIRVMASGFRGFSTVVRPMITGLTTAFRVFGGIVSVAMGAARVAIDAAKNPVQTAARLMGVALSALRGVITNVVAWFRGLAQAVGERIGALMGIVRSIPGRVKGVFSGAVNWLVTAGRNIIRGLLDGIGGIIGNVRDRVAGIKDRVQGAVSGAGTWLKDAGRAIIQGAIDGINGMLGAIIEAAKSVVGRAIDAVKGALKINSPSRVFMDIGGSIGEGMALGIERSADLANRAAGQMADMTINRTISVAAATPGGTQMPSQLVVVDKDGVLVGTMDVAASQALDGMRTDLLYRTVA